MEHWGQDLKQRLQERDTFKFQRLPSPNVFWQMFGVSIAVGFSSFLLLAILDWIWAFPIQYYPLFWRLPIFLAFITFCCQLVYFIQEFREVMIITPTEIIWEGKWRGKIVRFQDISTINTYDRLRLRQGSSGHSPEYEQEIRGRIILNNGKIIDITLSDWRIPFPIILKIPAPIYIKKILDNYMALNRAKV